MRVVVQRVKKASVDINKKIFSSINQGLLILLGISVNDIEKDLDYILDKIINLRIFIDDDGKMNNDISSVNGEFLIVSQFTLYGDVRKGRRPSYTVAQKGEKAEEVYNLFINKIKEKYSEKKVKCGQFGAKMEVSLVNDGPVTILLDSEKKF